MARLGNPAVDVINGIVTTAFTVLLGMLQYLMTSNYHYHHCCHSLLYSLQTPADDTRGALR